MKANMNKKSVNNSEVQVITAYDVEKMFSYANGKAQV